MQDNKTRYFECDIDDKIVINNKVTITLLNTHKKQARLGIAAPPEVNIVRTELLIPPPEPTHKRTTNRRGTRYPARARIRRRAQSQQQNETPTTLDY